MISIQDDSYSFYKLSVDPFVKFLLLYFFNSETVSKLLDSGCLVTVFRG